MRPFPLPSGLTRPPRRPGRRRLALWLPLGLAVCAALVAGSALRGAGADVPTAANPPSNNATNPTPKLEEDGYDWAGRHQEILDIKDRVHPELVFIGDSITHAWGGLPETGARRTGEEVLRAAFPGRRILNLGFGWDRTQNVLWRLEHGELDGLHPRAVVIHIGSNNTSATRNARQNTPDEIAAAIVRIVEQVHAKAPAARILLMAVFPREERPDHPRRRQIGEINRWLRAQAGQVPGVVWIDLGPKLTRPDGTISREIMSDFCHPTARGYQIWADSVNGQLGWTP